MTIWDAYPPDYRAREVNTIQTAVLAGECMAVVGLSGAGKSNLFGFLAQRAHPAGAYVLVDGNRLAEVSPNGYYMLVLNALRTGFPDFDLSGPTTAVHPMEALETVLRQRMQQPPERLCLLLDRFDVLPPPEARVVSSGLRSLRDTFKYQLSLVTASRRPPDSSSELAELFFGSTLWLGPLTESDSAWSARQYAGRKRLDWDDLALRRLFELSRGYPALLRACCEAYAAGSPLDQPALRSHPAVQRRVSEFWSDQPSPEDIRLSGLAGHPLLAKTPAPASEPEITRLKDASLTANEHRLYQYLFEHAGVVCGKDELIRAVWLEDKVFIDGVRDDSLAQLVRRLRTKIEPDPEQPRHIFSVPGRGYRFIQ